MRIGIFGCTADPFTEAHAAIVGEVLAQKLVDRVIIAPTIVDWHREGKTSWLTDDQKCELISLMMSNDPAVKTLPMKKVGYYDIWDKDLRMRELCRGNPALEEKYVKNHGFIDTLVEIIRSKEWNFVGDKKNNEYYVILGTDSYLNFKTWGMWQEIPKLAKLIVVKGRSNVPLPAEDDLELPYIGLSIDAKYANVSATEVREKWISKGFEAYKRWLVGEFSKKYIKKNETLLHTPIFDVIKGSKTDTGLEPILVNAPDWVMLVVEKNGKLLVEKQFRYGSASAIEEFPCGTVEKGEDPLDAAIRELEEETGMRILDKNDVKKLGTSNPNPAFMTNTMHCYYVNLDKAKFKKTKQNLDEHEQIQFYFKDIDDFCQTTMKTAMCGKNNVPAMLISAIALLGFSKMEK